MLIDGTETLTDNGRILAMERVLSAKAMGVPTGVSLSLFSFVSTVRVMPCCYDISLQPRIASFMMECCE